jgi:chorismate synthase
MEADWDAICSIPSDAPLMCADSAIQTAMMAHIDNAKEKGDTLGGIFEVVAKNLPVGLGSHMSWEDKLDGRIAPRNNVHPRSQSRRDRHRRRQRRSAGIGSAR